MLCRATSQTLCDAWHAALEDESGRTERLGPDKVEVRGRSMRTAKDRVNLEVSDINCCCPRLCEPSSKRPRQPSKDKLEEALCASQASTQRVNPNEKGKNPFKSDEKPPANVELKKLEVKGPRGQKGASGKV